MNLEKARERYLHDAHFHQLVTYMAHMVEVLQFSPGEIREAAVFAELLVQERRTGSALRLETKATEDVHE